MYDIKEIGGETMHFFNLILSVILLNTFAFLTIKLRPRFFDVDLFKPMIKNFKLSLLPFGVIIVSTILFIIFTYFGTSLAWMYTAGQVVFVIGIIIWLLLLPNSGYLITELNLTHRDTDRKPVPIWYDIVSMTAFALSGIINTLANIVIIQFIGIVIVDPQQMSGKYHFALIITGFLINMLVSIGVYLGRTIRFNSWDILHITRFIKKLYNNFSKPGEWRNFFLFVTFHTALFMIIYVVIGVPYYFNV